jgi:hypothetical protein
MPPDIVTSILDQRGSVYGDFENIAHVAQELKLAARDGGKWDALPHDVKESVEMICTKISRIVNGEPEYLDNWDDICGYAKLVADRIRGK